MNNWKKCADCGFDYQSEECPNCAIDALRTELGSARAEIERLTAEQNDHLTAIMDAYYEMAFAVGDLSASKDGAAARRSWRLAKCADRLKKFVTDE